MEAILDRKTITAIFFIMVFLVSITAVAAPVSAKEALPQLRWSKTWGGTDEDEAWGVAVSGSGIYVAGITESYGAGETDAFLLKYG